MPPSFSLSGQVRIVPSWTDALSTTDVVDSVTIQVPLSFTNGTGPAQADAYWRDVRFVTGSTTDFVDLGALPIKVFGGESTLNLALLKLVYVRNLSTNVSLGYFLAGGAAAPDMPPGSLFCWSSPMPADNEPFLRDFSVVEVFNNTATGASYEIVLVGVKAS